MRITLSLLLTLVNTSVNVLLFRVPTVFCLEPLLEARGLSQRELARLAGVSYVTVNRLCRNATTQVSLKTLDAIADALDVQPGELIAKDPKRGRR